MDLARARFVTSQPGRDALAGLDPDLAGLPLTALADALRKQFGPPEASALAEQLVLRARARERWGDDFGLLFTPPGLEMMTHPLVAARRARRLAAIGLPVSDLTCGLGGDLRAIALRGIPAAGLERDGPIALLAAANVPRAAVVQGDALNAPLRLDRSVLILDPSRREGSHRRFDPAAFSPPFEAVLELARGAPAAVVKAPPGLDRGLAPDAELEAVQLGRGMREVALWFGAAAQPGLRRAVLLPKELELTSDQPECTAVAKFGPVLFDPESCVTRAGLVTQLAHLLDARLLDPEIAYLSGDNPVATPFAAAFEVLESLPFSVSRLKTRLRERGWRPVDVRRRAFPIEPDELLRLLGPIAGDAVTLLCTTIGGARTVIVGRRVS